MKSLDDRFTPMQEADINTLAKAKDRRNQYWSALHSMRPEYLSEFKGIFDLTVRPSMHYWAEQKYGFKMGLNSQGDYTDTYTVTDPKKFILFQIKYLSNGSC